MTKKDWQKKARKVFDVCSAIIIALAVIAHWMGVKMHPVNQFLVGLLSVECAIMAVVEVYKVVSLHILHIQAYKKLLYGITILRERHSTRYKEAFENPERIKEHTEHIQSFGKDCLEFADFIKDYKYFSKNQKTAIQNGVDEVNYLMSNFLPQKRAL